MTRFDKLVVATWLLNAYDAATTVYVSWDCPAVEINPIMRFCIEQSPWFFVAVKISILTAALAIMRKLPGIYAKKAWFFLIGTFMLYVAICVWNTHVVIQVLTG